MFSLNPTIGGSNPGIRAEIIHSVQENVNLICGCSLTTHPSAYASVSVHIYFASQPSLDFNCIVIMVFFFNTGWEVQVEWKCGELRGSIESRNASLKRWSAFLFRSVKQWCRVLIFCIQKMYIYVATVT